MRIKESGFGLIERENYEKTGFLVWRHPFYGPRLPVLIPGVRATETPGVFTDPVNYSKHGIGFTIPAGWRIILETADLTAQPDNDYYGLGVKPYIVIEQSSQTGPGSLYFTIAISPLAEGETLESRYNQAYEGAIPEPEKITEQVIDLNNTSGYEIKYERPWGEPWWKFDDVWMEKEGLIYVLSFRGSPSSFNSTMETRNLLIASFHFEE